MNFNRSRTMVKPSFQAEAGKIFTGISLKNKQGTGIVKKTPPRIVFPKLWLELS